MESGVPHMEPSRSKMQKRPARHRHLIVAALALLSVAPAGQAQDLLHFDPAQMQERGSARPVVAAQATSVVPIHIDPHTPVVRIPSGFYGINAQPGTVNTEFANKELLRALRPDAIRVMTHRRVDWIKGKGRRVHHLSSRKGQYEWRELDRLVEAIVDIGATPYLTLGFGPPQWLVRPGAPSRRAPPEASRMQDYADFMAAIAGRYASRVDKEALRVTVENEPENVGYSLVEYIRLFEMAKQSIHKRSPGVQVGGPSTGYATWPQPGGKKLTFAHSSKLLRTANVPFDFFDWHIYSHSPTTVLKTVDVVRRLYGTRIPLVIGELNRDWRYSGDGLDIAQRANTSWDSVAWLAEVYDQLQLKGVDQVFYFTWKERSLGLVSADLSEVRPNYFLFWALTNVMGRERVACEARHSVAGCIATKSAEGVRVLIYNRTDRALAIKTNLSRATEVVRFDEDWYQRNKRVETNVPNMPRTKNIPAQGHVPPGGFVVYESRL